MELKEMHSIWRAQMLLKKPSKKSRPAPLMHHCQAPKLYTCNQCTKGYAHAKNLREHKAKHRNKRLTAAPTEQTTIDTEERSREETVKEKPTQDKCNTGGNCFI
ncbi:hypothetical protein HBI56_210750 [Parastagonospora nodorum]|nr:hypothetical protein HBI09_191830 [Parastagonospora nodorum]KAH4184434.1 hypothetical protein HBH42_189920 [Parastagonospora nodorum]KAH4801326.1 hypothetical protein HBH61_198890 [Parastagonospora nodorum]KAH5012156.1 hypothetical protein HBI75_198870 [Parastagonospora nodorum]KAH5172231.1 hypothetical protein HBH68_203130 [Parastagonospora nodorum]